MLANYKGSSSSRFSRQHHDAGTLRIGSGSDEYLDERNADLGAKAPPVSFEAIGVRRPQPHEEANTRLDAARERYGQEKLWLNGVLDGITGDSHFGFTVCVVAFVGVMVFMRTRGVI